MPEQIGQNLEGAINKKPAEEQSLIVPIVEKKEENLPILASEEKDIVIENTPNKADTAEQEESFLEKKVDAILSFGLENIYAEMSGDLRKNFKKTGEDIVNGIFAKKDEMQIEDIIILIQRWLYLIPNISSAWMEAESRNRANKILKLFKENTHHE